MPLPILADLLKQDPDLERRLKEAGIWKRVDAGWALGSALGSAATHLGYPKDLWRGEQDAAIAEIRAKAGRVE